LPKTGTLSTLAYTNHRVAIGSDYQELKLLFEHHVAPFDIVANAGFSIYNRPDASLGQERLRDFSFAGSLQGSARNPFVIGVKEEDSAEPITFAFTGRFQHLAENKNRTDREANIGSFQAKIQFPVAPGLSIPVAYTYSSATELMAKPENRFNVGLSLEMSKILAFRRARKIF
jgi:hypothetical protein